MKVKLVRRTLFLALALCSVSGLWAASNPISSVTLLPTSVVGGASSTGTVTLKSAAPTGGAVVTLKSSNAAATVPVSVTVPATKTSTTFTVTTTPVASSASASITATYGTGSSSATLTVTAPSLSAVSVSPATVQGGTSSTGTVTLTSLAPTAGIAVTLTSSNTSAATVPATVTVTNSLTANFPVTTLGVSSTTSVTITAKLGTVTKTATLTVNPAPPAVSSVSVTPNSLLGGMTSSGTVNLSAPAPPGGVTVSLGTSNPAVASVAASVPVGAGLTSANFTVTTFPLGTDTTVSISANTAGGTPQSTSLMVVANLTLSLDAGSGPFYTNVYQLSVKGHVLPAVAGPGTIVTEILGTQNVTVTPASDGSFTLPAIGLNEGSNLVSVSAANAGSGKSAGPVTATYVLDQTPPTATAVLATQIPDPTNQPVWVLTGTTLGYQGPTENVVVQMNGELGNTLATFPIAADGTWSGQYTFPEGGTPFTLYVVDRVGNLGPGLQHRVNVDTQGINIVFQNQGPDYSAGPYPTSWPMALDEQFAQKADFYDADGGSLVGSHMDAFFDEVGTYSTLNQGNCSQDNLSCLQARKSTPDFSVDFTTDSQVLTFPLMHVGSHTIRMVVRDPFGKVTERGSVLVVAQSDDIFVVDSQGDYIAAFAVPEGNFAVPGPVTTQIPKIVMKTSVGGYQIDCGDVDNPHDPVIEYFTPGSKSGGTWSALPIKTTTFADGRVEIALDTTKLPRSGIPLTTNASGQKVLRLRSNEVGTFLGDQSGETLGVLGFQYGRRLCVANQLSGLSTAMLQDTVTFGRDPVTGYVAYDLPYRTAVSGDSAAPQIDTSAIVDVATESSGAFIDPVTLRVTDLNGDLNYGSVSVATAGCSMSSCTFAARLMGDQMTATTLPGGYFAVSLPLLIGANNFTATASDDAGHLTTKNFTINRSLTAVEAVISSPAAAGQTYMFCSPQVITFDASQSVNRTSPPVSLRYQWTTATTGSYVRKSNSAAYPENFGSADSRRVIVSSTAIAAPDPTSATPCASAPAGQCSVATVNVQPYTGPGGGSFAQILSPADGASIRNDVSVSLSGTVGEDGISSFVYWWTLTRSSDQRTFVIPQASGTGSDPNYSLANQILSLKFDSISGITAGAYSLIFHGAYQTPSNCIVPLASTTIGIVITQKQYTSAGVAPGVALASQSGVRLYGSSFDGGAVALLTGPIYSLANPTVPLCSGSGCPQSQLTATASPDGSTLDFDLPAGLSSGYYQVAAFDPAANVTSNAQTLEIDPAQVTQPTKTMQFSNIATPIFSGQTISGQFLEGRDPSQNFSDVDYYYFVATAGSTLSASLDRTDTTLSWLDPSEIDPQLEIVAPDGTVYQNLESADNQPGVDFNSSLTNAVLPQTGTYFIYAASLKGAGGYSLSFSMTPAPPGVGHQIVPFSDNDRTVPVNTPGLQPGAMVLDKRGYPISGAVTQWSATPDAGETGAVSFANGGMISTSSKGFTVMNTTLTLPGKASFTTALQNPALIQTQADAKVMSIPVYAAVASTTPRSGHLRKGSAWLDVQFEKLKRIEPIRGASPPVRITSGQPVAKTQVSKPMAEPAARRVSSVGPSTELASTGVVGIQPIGHISTLSITSCSPAPFRAAGITTSVQGPLTVILTDETPATGQSSPQGTVDTLAGIHGHRVNHTIRMKIAITDGTGTTPTYPVLVRLVLSGSKMGTLILDPDGARTQCETASFIWHEQNAQGQVISLNEEFEYTLGTFAAVVGVTPNPIQPVWGTTEGLSLSIGTLDNNPAASFSAGYPVEPEAGPPVSLQWNPKEPQPPNQLTFQSMYAVQFQLAFGGIGTFFGNAYYLLDSYGNTGFYPNTSASASGTSPAANITPQFTSQVQTSDPDVDPWAFTVGFTWTSNPSWPTGTYVTTLMASGTDPETGPFAISQPFTAIFTTQAFNAITPYQGYDYNNDSSFQAVNGTFVDLATVSPGGARLLPDGTNLLRSTILLLTGTKFAFFGGDTDGEFPPEGQPGDPMIFTGTSEKFDVTLRDGKGNLVKDGSFAANLCPIYDHTQPAVGGTLPPFPGTCPDTLSSNGVITGLQPTHGYIGLTLPKAPSNPGDYYYLVTPESGNQFNWTTPNYANLNPGFRACTVTGGEILDHSFVPIQELIVDQAKSVYVRLLDGASAGSSAVSVDLVTYESDGTKLTQLNAVPLTQSGGRSTFLSVPIAIYPQGSMPPPGLALSAPARPKGVFFVYRSGTNDLLAKCVLDPGIVVEFFVDTINDGTNTGKTFHADNSAPDPLSQQPNILFANTADSTLISAWAHTYSPNTKDTPGVPNVSLTAHVSDCTFGSLSSGACTDTTSQTDANGWASFAFTSTQSAGLSMGVVGTTAVSVNMGGVATPVATTNIYSYNTFDFAHLSLTMSDLSNDTGNPGISVGQIQTIFTSYGSYFANATFKGTDFFVCDAASQSCTFDQAIWFYAQDNEDCPNSPCQLTDQTVTPVPAAQEFFQLAAANGVNAFMLLARIELEQSLLSTGAPTSGQLSKAMGESASNLVDQLQRGGGTITNLRDDPNDTADLGIPISFPFFLGTEDTPIERYSFSHVVNVGTSAGNSGCSQSSDSLIPRNGVGFGAWDRPTYVLYRYTNWVQVCGNSTSLSLGGGNRSETAIVNRLHNILGE